MNRILNLLVLCISLAAPMQAMAQAGLRPVPPRAMRSAPIFLPPEMRPQGMQLPPLPAIEPLYAWCNQAIVILQEGQAQASRLVYNGQFHEALGALEGALHEALAVESTLGRDRTLTGRVLTRGIQIINSLRQDFGGLDPRELQGFLNFVGKWVQLVIEVSNDLDQNWYLPYLQQVGECGYGCGGFDLAAFQGRYLELATRELRVITESLSNGYIPFGSGRFFLRASQYVIVGVIHEDLGGSVYAPDFGCTTLTLGRLLNRIQAGLASPGRYPELVQDTIYTVNNAISQIGHGYGYCRR